MFERGEALQGGSCTLLRQLHLRSSKGTPSPKLENELLLNKKYQSERERERESEGLPLSPSKSRFFIMFMVYPVRETDGY